MPPPSEAKQLETLLQLQRDLALEANIEKVLLHITLAATFMLDADRATLYVVDSARFLLLPLPPVETICAACGRATPAELLRFGETALLDLAQPCGACGSVPDLGRGRARLRSGAIFLLEELCARAALSVELPRAPRDEELPDAGVAALLRDAFGGYDELADDGVEPS